MFNETAFTFKHQQKPNLELVGIIHYPEKKRTDKALLIIVGGPQYRVGSHRQFLLLARSLAEQGITVMRFDYQGMGDADGEITNFEHISSDIDSAVEILKQKTDCQEIILWGLCDAASAALFYSLQAQDKIAKLILLNPWIRTTEGEAKAIVKYYYLKRLKSPDFWKKLLKGGVNIISSIQSLQQNIQKIKKPNKSINTNLSLPEQMQKAVMAFNKPILFILSEEDLVADEFRDLIKTSVDWKMAMQNKGIKLTTIEGANHTFSKRDWRQKVEVLTKQFID